MMKAVIFDMDGVLIDSEPLHFEVDKMVLKQLNINVPGAYLDRFVGYTNRAMWDAIKNEHRIDQSTEALMEFQMRAKLKHLQQRPYQAIEGIKTLLDDLKTNGMLLGIASSSPIVFIEAVIRKTGISGYFDHWISGEDVARSKPEPDIFLAMSGILGVNPVECLVIEDSKSGTVAAGKAGMKCIGYQNMNSGVQDLSAATLVIDKISQINYLKMRALF